MPCEGANRVEPPGQFMNVIATPSAPTRTSVAVARLEFTATRCGIEDQNRRFRWSNLSAAAHTAVDDSGRYTVTVERITGASWRLH